MIFRRLKAHVEKENWFAVAIDFAIVVIGVFIGIQVANWNEANARQRAAFESLESVLRDVESDIEHFQTQSVFWEQVIREGQKALSATPVGSDEDPSSWPTLLAFHNASQYDQVTFKQAAYAEFLNTGQFRLIRDDDLRDQLQQYYAPRGLGVVQRIPAYRETVRRLIPFQYQKYIFENCVTTSTQGDHVFDPCPPPETVEGLARIVNGLQADPDIRADLDYALTNAFLTITILNEKVNEAKAVSDSLRNVLTDDFQTADSL